MSSYGSAVSTLSNEEISNQLNTLDIKHEDTLAEEEGDEPPQQESDKQALDPTNSASDGEKEESVKDNENPSPLSEEPTDQEDSSVQNGNDSTDNSSAEEDKKEEAMYRQRQLTQLVHQSEQDNEDMSSAVWKEQKRHYFVLTEAGKPVYSRHGNEDKLSSVMGVMLAIVSCFHDRNDVIRHIVAGSHKFVFSSRPPLILVAVCTAQESVNQVGIHLDHLYNTIVSVLTLSQLRRIYEKQKNFDLRRLLTGMDKFFAHLCNSMDNDAQYLLGAIHCLPLPGTVRDNISLSLQQAKTDDLAFAVLISSGRLVSICRMKEHKLDTKDLQIILNFITTSSSFDAGETWLPLCLPHFNPEGFLHAHISYLDESLNTCLVLLSADRDAFFQMSEAKSKVVTKMQKYGCLDALRVANKNSMYTVGRIGIPDLRYFMYKSKNTSQFTCPEFTVPYQTEVARERLFGKLQRLHGQIHNPASTLKLIHAVGEEETLLAWVASGFELYAAFSPLTTKQQAIAYVDRLLKWIKQSEDELFLLRTVTF